MAANFTHMIANYYSAFPVAIYSSYNIQLAKNLSVSAKNLSVSAKNLSVRWWEPIQLVQLWPDQLQ